MSELSVSSDFIEDNKAKPERKRSNNNMVNNRRVELQKIIDEFKKKGVPITRQGLIDELQKKGYTSNRNILYDDRTALNKDNTFISDLTESNYSQMMQDIYEKLSWVEEQAMTQYNKKWTNSKLVTKNTAQGTFEETHTTDEIAQPKAAFLSIIKDTQKLKYEFLTGNNIHLSAVLLMQKFQQLNQKIFELERSKKSLLNPPKKLTDYITPEE